MHRARSFFNALRVACYTNINSFLTGMTEQPPPAGLGLDGTKPIVCKRCQFLGHEEEECRTKICLRCGQKRHTEEQCRVRSGVGRRPSHHVATAGAQVPALRQALPHH